MTANPWSAVLQKLPLSRAEQAAVKRFELDPMGRSFLSVADILRAHRKIEDSLELLSDGVERHPTFTVARVVLARELYGRGLLAQAWHTLTSATQNLSDNVLAQKLKLKLAILIGLMDIAEDITRHMFLHHMHDEETRRLAEQIRSGKLKGAQEILSQELRQQGIEPIIPSPKEIEISDGNVALSDASDTIPAPPLNDAVELAPEFHVLPLHEVLRGVDVGSGRIEASQGVELDSTTLADLYVRQGHFSKAMSIYRRLLRLTPTSDFLKRKIRELTVMEKQQRDEDLAVDPSVVDQMEAVEIIDAQIKFFESLLNRVEHKL
jgi:hypothetical protein